MSKLNRFVSVALTATTAVWASGAFLLVPVASAQSADLQTQINALLKQIAQLQSQLATSGAPSMSSFTRDLTVGSKGADVTSLQQYLNGKGYLNASPTGYFGGLTRAAVVAWQKVAGVSPAAGYFGSKSRAAFAAMGGTPVVTPPAGGPTAPASGLAVSWAPDNPVAGSLIPGSGRTRVVKVSLTAGSSGAVTISEIKFRKQGVLSDSSISGAYLSESGRVLYQYNSISSGVIDFAGLNLVINAGQTRSIALAIDPAAGLSAGNTVSFSLASAADITSTDVNNNPVVETGNFPFAGNIFTVTTVNNPSIATLTIASSSVGSTVYAGTTGVLISQWTTTVVNSPVNLNSVKFSVVGSANKSDLKNVTLKVNGIAVGPVLATVGADGSAFFDLSASPVKLNTGTSNLQVYGDVMGSPSYNFDFGLLNSYDLLAVDSQYNIPVAVTVNGGGTGTNSGHQVTINQGQITVTVDTATPTSNIAKGGSGTTLAKFDIYAAGEAVKVKFLGVKFTFAGVATTTTNLTLTTVFKNVSIVDDAGNQVGTTINNPPTANACDNTTGRTGYNTTDGTLLIAAPIYVDCFGTSASPINYIVPANTTRVLSLKADVQSTASFTSVTAALIGNTSNLQGLTSSVVSNSGSGNGSALTLAINPLVVSKNGAIGDQTYAKGSFPVKIGSYTFTASSAEGETVSNFTISMNASSTNFQNLKAKVGSLQIGSSYATLSSGNYTFSTPFNVPVGGTAIADVYADSLSSGSGVMGPSLTAFVSCTATGAQTFSSVSCSGTPAGQVVTISSGPTLTVSNNNSLASRQIVMGNSQVSLAKILLLDTAGIEAIRIQEFKFTVNTAAATGQAFGNLKLYDANGNAIAGAGPLSTTSAAPSYVADFNFGSASTLTVPQGGTLGFELRGDVSPFTVGSNIENATSVVIVAATSTDIIAYGQSSNASVVVTGSPTFVTLTTQRSKLLLSAIALGTDSNCGGYSVGNAAVNRSRVAVDYVSCIHLSADPSGQEVKVNTLTLSFAGAAVSGTFAVQLIDPQTATNYDGSAANVTCASTGNSCSTTFNFTGTSISNNAPRYVVVQVNSTGFANVSQQFDGMDLTLAASANVKFFDGSVSGSTQSGAGLSLSSDVAVPLLLTHIDYQ